MATGQRASKPETVICTYRVKKGKQAAFLRQLRGHWPRLRSLGLVTPAKPLTYCGVDESGAPVVVDIFTWKDGRAADTAHHLPEVGALWEKLGLLVEERLGRPRFEFPHFQPVKLGLGAARPKRR